MGLKTITSGATFLSFKNGKVAKQVETGGTELTVTNPSTNEQITRNYEFYSSVSGVLKSVNLFEGKYGKSIKISIVDDEQIYVIDLSLESDYALDFLKRLPNLHTGQIVEIRPVISEAERNGEKVKNKEGKQVYNYYTSVKTPFGDDSDEMVSVKSFYSDKNPLPEWKKITLNGKPTVDKTDYIEALVSNIESFSANE